ncbi:MAG: anaerobic sulfatase maturase [Oscillospiraceae bacterium]
MPPLSLLIKPASSLCNLQCKYCFYHDEAKNRDIASYGIMSDETLENIIKKALSFAQQHITIAFQGGEPTLAGLAFYEHLFELEEIYNVNKIKIEHCIQTNGYIIDREWTQFLKKHNFLVGLSLDGNKEMHDMYRVDAQSTGSYARVMHTAQLFNQYGVEYNILTVVTRQLARNIGKIYGFYKRSEFTWQQYIPCLDPIGNERGKEVYSLNPSEYQDFLCKLFDLWYQDLIKDEYISIRFFDNIVHMLHGKAPESCAMRGVCSIGNVIEADGEVYPCDFYVLDNYKLGNLNDVDFIDIASNAKKLNFIENSAVKSTECTECRWQSICRGGCRRDRDINGVLSLNYYCASYKGFFEYAIDRLQKI